MKKEQKKGKAIKILFCLIIILFAIYLYGRYLNTNSLKVHEMAITNELLPIEYNGLKIAHFTDLHYGRTTNEENLKKIIKELNKLKADIIIFTGDLFDSKDINEKDKKLITKHLKEINAKLFKFAVIGNYHQKYLNTYTSILEESEFILLNNNNKLVYYQSKNPINFIGLTNTNNINELYNNNYFNITIMHEPDLIKNISNTQIAFAGHSLGGQIRIPFIGGIKKIDGATTYYDNYYKINNTKLYISNGIGTQDISFRIFNSPSITLYRLYKN